MTRKAILPPEIEASRVRCGSHHQIDFGYGFPKGTKVRLYSPTETAMKCGRPQSPRTLMRSEHYGDIRWGVKPHVGDVGWTNGVLSLPHYVTFLLKRHLSECDPLCRSAALPANRPLETLRDPWLGE